MLWVVLGAIGGVVVYDLVQRKHAILRNFPIIGHFRYWLEAVGPELRQYIVTSNNEERPFSRDERRWVYASSKLENTYFGFGSDNEMESSGSYLIIKPRTLSHRKAGNGRLTVEESDRAARVARVMALAERTFANRGKAHLWLHKSLASLDDRRPIDLIQTTTGTRLVEDILAKIAWGAAA